MKGPTLLDLKDLFRTSLTMITYLFIVRSIGSIAGAFSGNKNTYNNTEEELF